MKRSSLWNGCHVVVVLWTCCLLCCSSLSAASLLPGTVAVPHGNVLAHVIYANGLYIYSCPTAGGAWEVSNAYADLYYSRGAFELEEERIGVYDRLPTADSSGGIDRWTLYPPLTESSVVGKVDATEAPGSSLSFELYSATQSQGSGIFSAVTYIQRTYTEGGLPPGGACTTVGAQTQSPFSGEFWFYTAGRMPYSAASSIEPFVLLKRALSLFS